MYRKHEFIKAIEQAKHIVPEFRTLLDLSPNPNAIISKIASNASTPAGVIAYIADMFYL